MKKIVFVLIVSAIFSHDLNAQFWKLRRMEISGGLGTTQFYGDIGGFSRGENMLGLKDFSFKQTRFNLNANGKYRLRKDISARLNLTYGKFHSTDERGVNIERNLESSTGFFEIAAIGEFYFLKNKSENSFLAQKGKSMPFTTILSLIDGYAFTGFGIISYNVKPNVPLSTQTSKIKGIAPILPAGLGVSFNYSPDLNFGAELGGRFAFSDDLEGYTSPFSQKNDSYFFFNFSITYKIRTGGRNNPSF